MPEPTSTTAVVATLATGALAVPMLTAFGVPLGLRADILLAGFSGSVAAMVLLNTVPRSGDTAWQLVKDTGRRIAVACVSALFAGYCTTSLGGAVSDGSLQSLGFLAGAGAQTLLPMLIAKLRGGTA